MPNAMPASTGPRYDPTDGTLGSVCRVMSGFSDKFYKVDVWDM